MITGENKPVSKFNVERSHQALMNEIKGSLFEFLLGKEISLVIEKENDFYAHIPSAFWPMFEYQEFYLRQYDPLLLKSMETWAKICAEQMLSWGWLNLIQSCELVGKEQQKTDEADLILRGVSQDESSSVVRKISLKLGKSQSYINTKSAGIKSFCQRYFGCEAYIQEQMNYQFEKQFWQAIKDMHQYYQIPFDSAFHHWRKHGLPTLPGGLEEACKKILFDYYQYLNDVLYDFLFECFQEEQEIFQRGILRLMGGGIYGDLSQIIVYTINSESTPIISALDFQDIKSISILSIEKKDKSIYIVISSDQPEKKISEKFILQIRVKPMNTFTTCSFKVNCAIKRIMPVF